MHFTLGSLILILFKIHLLNAINSYIYLPDKRLQEEQPIGTLILDLNEELSSQTLMIHNRSSYIEQYTFLDDSKTNSTNTYFLIDIITGRITTKRFIDRESMCMNKHCLNSCESSNGGSLSTADYNCKINLKILLMPLSNILSVNILVEDINDNRPKFRKDLLNQSIYENVPIGYKIPIDVAYDADVGENSIQHYKIVESPTAPLNGTFELEWQKQSNELALIVRKKIDREDKSFYNFSIMAYDGGKPSPYTGLLLVHLNILDVNDNNPIFDFDVYKLTISEDTQPGVLIGTVHARDGDEGLNGQIRYSIASTQNEMGAAMGVNTKKSENFNVNERTGELYLKSPVDYEDESQINLVIEARDLNGQDLQLSLASYCTVEITILDYNDNAPEISVSFLGSLLSPNKTTDSNQIYMDEHIEANKFIAHVSITDKDSDENGRVDWSMYINNEQIDTNTVDAVLFKTQPLNNNSFILSTGKYAAKLLDRELYERLNLSIQAWDNGQPRLQTFFNFTINLADVNDNPPQFNRSFYNLTMYENNQVNTIIYKFDVNDADVGDNARIRFSLKKHNINANMPFRIDNNGYLYATATFDRELMDVYRFYVVASDSGKDMQWNTSSLVQVNILDLNDNQPKILYSIKNEHIRDYVPANNTLVLELNENLSDNYEVIGFSSYDSDINSNARSKFYFQSDEASEYFSLSSNGTLAVRKKLDVESQQLFAFTIVCENYGDKPTRQSSSLNLVISLLDVNDNCPRAAAIQSVENRRFILKSNWNLSEYLFKANFTDDDLNSNTNSKLKFLLGNYNYLFEFYVNKVYDGKVYEIFLRFKNINLSLIKLGKFQIKLKIIDQGQPVSCETVHVFELYIGDTTMPDIVTYDQLEYKLRNLVKQTNNDYQYDNDIIVSASGGGRGDTATETTVTTMLSKTVHISQKSKLSYIFVLVIIFLIIVFLIVITFMVTAYFYNQKHGATATGRQYRKRSPLLVRTNTGKQLQPPAIMVVDMEKEQHLAHCDHHSDCHSYDVNSYTSSSLTKDTKLSSSCSNSSVERQANGCVSVIQQPTSVPAAAPAPQVLTASTYLMRLTDLKSFKPIVKMPMLNHYINVNGRCNDDDNDDDDDEIASENDGFLTSNEHPPAKIYNAFYSSEV